MCRARHSGPGLVHKPATGGSAGARGGQRLDEALVERGLAENRSRARALIMAADAFDGPGILVPTTNADLFRWCLERKLRVVQLMTLMTVGLYTPPQGAHLPSILY